MKSYRLLDGTQILLRNLSAREQEFIGALKKMVKEQVSYFEIYRMALGPGSPALQGRARVDRELVESPVYQVARDLATRAGIVQGLLLAREHEGERTRALDVVAPLSVAQAAQHIGISRIAAYKAIKQGRLPHVKVGNVTVVRRADAERYKDARKSGRESRTGKTTVARASSR